jgi:hypothetical protein
MPGILAEVDHQIELRCHLDRKVSRLGALENPADVDADAAIGIGYAGSVAHQAAGLGVIARRALPDIAPALQTAERLLRQAHSINEMVPIYRRLLAS